VPATDTEPVQFGHSPASTRSSVDFPEPEPPTRPKVSLGSTASEALRTA
jgi:hypothetical protein